MEKTLCFDSLLMHGGMEDGPAGATAVPVVQSSSFAYKTAEELEDVFRGRAVGQVYTRIGNPTTEALERRLAILEGGGSGNCHGIRHGGNHDGGHDDRPRRR